MPSSVVSRIEYNAETQKLVVVFVSGDVYVYSEVPEKEYKNFKAATSKGTFLNRSIKKKYKTKKIS